MAPGETVLPLGSRMRRWGVGLAVGGAMLGITARVGGTPPHARPHAPGAPPIYVAPPLAAPARFVMRDRRAAAFFVDAGFAIALRGSGGGWGLHYALVDARPVAPRPEAERRERVNEFVGPEVEWRAGLPAFSRVVYDEPYPGVTLAIEARRHGLAYRYSARRAADAGRVRIRVRGASAVRAVDGGLALEVETGAGSLREAGLRCTQEGRAIPCRYGVRRVDGDAWEYGVTLAGPYDPTRPIDVDPEIEWGSYLGGGANDPGGGIAVDGAGDLLLAGLTTSADFPVPGGFDTTYAGGLCGGEPCGDAFVTKIDGAGLGVLWSSYLGGGGQDVLRGLAVDATGAAYVAGWTDSSDFPTTGGFQPAFAGGRDAFVTKIDASGSALVWSSYLGGATQCCAGDPAEDEAYGVAVDAEGNAYVVGTTSSVDFPTPGGFDTTLDGVYDSFVARVDASGSSLSWSSFVGGTLGDNVEAIATDAAGDLYLAGSTMSSDFPTPGGFDTVYDGGGDAVIAKVAADGSGLLWSSFLGGDGYESIQTVAVDEAGCVYVTGGTSSSDFPVPGGFDTTLGGSLDAFVAKIYADGSNLVWSSYFGGTGVEWAVRNAVSGADVYIVGSTDSLDLPAAGGFDTTYGGGSEDAFVARLEGGDGVSLVWSSYLGGSLDDLGGEVAIDDEGEVFVAGGTNSSDFPVPGGFDTVLSGEWDTFVLRISPEPVDAGVGDGGESESEAESESDAEGEAEAEGQAGSDAGADAALAPAASPGGCGCALAHRR